MILEIFHQSKLLKSYPLTPGKHTVGSKQGQVILNYPTVSREHAVIDINNEQVFIRDLKSRNGTWLNEQQIPTEQDLHWAPSQPLRIGPFELHWTNKKPHDVCEVEAGQVEEKARYLSELYADVLSRNPLGAQQWLAENSGSFSFSEQVQERIYKEFHENGPLSGLLENKSCREILINAHNEIFVDLGEGLQPHPQHFLSAQTYMAWILRLVHKNGGRLDLQHPICACTLSDGARFHGVLPPISPKEAAVAIRRFGSAPTDEYYALKSGWVDEVSLEILKKAVREKKNILISGGTSTGKTSLLNFLCNYLPPSSRSVSIEDTIEINPSLDNFVQLQARASNPEGKGEVSLRDLVRCALRMRPDRIIVGECRGAEVLDLLQALNTGHPGSMTTLHANSSQEALHRLELLALLGSQNLSLQSVREWICSSIDLIVQLERSENGKRTVIEISERNGREFRTCYSKK